MKKLPIQGLLMNQYWGFKPHSLVAVDKKYELCFLPAVQSGADEEYWLISRKEKIIFGYTGMIQKIEKRRTRWSKPRVILTRSNAYGNFKPDRPRKIKKRIDSVYRKTAKLDFDSNKNRNLFEWDAERLFSRFEDFGTMYADSDIIPEYNDKMTLVKISEGCPRKCIYCPEPSSNGIDTFDIPKIQERIKQARRIQLKYHGDFINRMDEGFLNTSDILWFSVLEKADISKIISIYYNTFPETRKLGTFMGVPNINKTSREELAGYFNNAQGINRVLVGIESGHDITSRFLGKNETAEDKRDAIKKLENIGYKVKMIVQVGTVGQGFYDESGNFISGRQGLESTVELLSSVMELDSRNKVLVSKYVPIKGTPLADKRSEVNGKIVHFESSKELEEEIKWFTTKLAKKGISHDILESDYESALEGRIRNC